MLTAGSSPLARGLRFNFHSHPVKRRIIPARAGFTADGLHASASGRDHPRSRGVYTRYGMRGTVPRGSSPLARGLPDADVAADSTHGIIPARAGFTRFHHFVTIDGRDHPRSRGVYPTTSGQVGGEAGSSPLARGLPAGVSRDRPPAGIIPARAGFTFSQREDHRHPGDHPRSRGVYIVVECQPGQVAGSSPLARGLLAHDRGTDGESRIIPARAGFTPPRPEWRRERWDHPRSRGVYSGGKSPKDQVKGSSPLARGLPRHRRPRGDPERIIPARAGFTGAGQGRIYHGGDHPRSRGVYKCMLSILSRVPGSSPLARGLPAIVPGNMSGSRIIPARAGFTVGDDSPADSGEDHPRSRGVYYHEIAHETADQGSSPLARGLRVFP